MSSMSADFLLCECCVVVHSEGGDSKPGDDKGTSRSVEVLGCEVTGEVGRKVRGALGGGGTGGGGSTDARSLRPTPKNLESFAARSRRRRKSDETSCDFSCIRTGETLRGAVVVEGGAVHEDKPTGDEIDDAREALCVSGV